MYSFYQGLLGCALLLRLSLGHEKLADIYSFMCVWPATATFLWWAASFCQNISRRYKLHPFYMLYGIEFFILMALFWNETFYIIFCLLNKLYQGLRNIKLWCNYWRKILYFKAYRVAQTNYRISILSSEVSEWNRFSISRTNKEASTPSNKTHRRALVVESSIVSESSSWFFRKLSSRTFAVEHFQ